MDWDQLTGWEQGFLLASIGDQAGCASPLHRVEDTSAQRIARCIAALEALPSVARREQITRLTRSLLTPLPEGLEAVDPSWVADRVAAEPPAIQALMRDILPPPLRDAMPLPVEPAPPVSPTVRGLIVQRVLAAIVPMPPPHHAPAPPARLTALEELARWSAARLRVALIHGGVLVLAAAARRAGPELLDSLASRLEPVWRGKLRQATRWDLPRLRRQPRVGDLSGLPQDALLLALGCQLAGPHLTALSRRQTAQRMSRPDGLALLEVHEPLFDAEAALALMVLADGWARGDRS